MSIVSNGQKHSINFTGRRIDTDGIFGADTQKNACMTLQKAMNMDYGAGLAEDGIFGSATESALRGHTVRNGETQYMVTALEILLMLRGYDPGGVESPGVFGAGLECALRCYQSDNGLSVDCVAGEATFKALVGASNSGRSDEWKKYDPNNLPNFGKDEFKCQCGCNSGDVCDELKCWAQVIRDHYGKPVTISSGYRCKAHNAEVGGVSNSNHCRGEAIDIYFDGMDIDDVKAFVNSKGLACGTYYSSGFCHVDLDGPEGNFSGD